MFIAKKKFGGFYHYGKRRIKSKDAKLTWLNVIGSEVYNSISLVCDTGERNYFFRLNPTEAKELINKLDQQIKFIESNGAKLESIDEVEQSTWSIQL